MRKPPATTKTNRPAMTSLARTVLTPLASLALLGVVTVTPGCYERVIRATGPGADRTSVEQPYQQNYEMDEWLFGSKVNDPPKRMK